MKLYRPQLALPGNASTNRAGVNLVELEKRGYGFDTKIDGVRVIAYHETDGNVRLINRSMVDVTNRYPEVVTGILMTFSKGTVVDGEVVATDGSFESTALRDKQNKPADVARTMKTHPVMFLAFDMLCEDGQEITSLPYVSRRGRLERHHAQSAFRSPVIGLTVVSSAASLYDQVKALGMEGVIAKQWTAPYQEGKRNPTWIKMKATFRVTCVATGYEPGKGARAHFGAMHLALLDPAQGRIVGCGRVGTGFTERQIRELKTLLDAGTPVAVEIEALNITKTGQLRFPVYRGIRSDLSVADATIDQLDQLPRC